MPPAAAGVRTMYHQVPLRPANVDSCRRANRTHEALRATAAIRDSRDHVPRDARDVRLSGADHATRLSPRQLRLTTTRPSTSWPTCRPTSPSAGRGRRRQRRRQEHGARARRRPARTDRRPVQDGRAALYCAQRTDDAPAHLQELALDYSAEASVLRQRLGIGDGWAGAGTPLATASASAARSPPPSGSAPTCWRSTNPPTTSTKRGAAASRRRCAALPAWESAATIAPCSTRCAASACLTWGAPFVRAATRRRAGRAALQDETARRDGGRPSPSSNRPRRVQTARRAQADQAGGRRSARGLRVRQRRSRASPGGDRQWQGRAGRPSALPARKPAATRPPQGRGDPRPQDERSGIWLSAARSSRQRSSTCRQALWPVGASAGGSSTRSSCWGPATGSR